MRRIIAMLTMLGALSAADIAYPAMNQLQAQQRLGDFVSVYKIQEIDEPGAPPRIDYRIVLIVHDREVKTYIMESGIPLPSRAALIACNRPLRQYCSRHAIWEYLNPKSGTLTVRHKPDPWVPGTFCNPAGFPIEPNMQPFEPLGCFENESHGTINVEWIDWFDRKWIANRFMALLRGGVRELDGGASFDLAMYAEGIDTKTGRRGVIDRGRRITVTLARNPALADYPLIDRFTFSADPADSSIPAGNYTVFRYRSVKSPVGAVPLLESCKRFTVAGGMYYSAELESFENIDKSEHVELCIDPGLAKNIWDETFRLDIEPK